MKKEESDKKATVYLCLPKGMVEWLKETAIRDNRTVSGFATHVLLLGKERIDAASRS